VKDYSVELVSGSTVSENFALNGSWSDTETGMAYGSDEESWNTNWTPAMLNDPSFGVRIACRLKSGGGTPSVLSAEIDQVQVVAHYRQARPVLIVNFDAAAENGKVKLVWSTSLELNNDYFMVERSRDAVTFEQVCEVPSGGNSLGWQHYTCFDDEPHGGLSYYRLRQVDQAGKITSFPMDVVELAVAEDISVSPGEGMVTIVVKSLNEPEVRVELYNIYGKKMWQRTEVFTDPETEVAISTEGMPPGFYYIKAQTATREYCKRTCVLQN
jgi:hypothetical protein